MTFDEYRALAAVNWSTLKAMRVSPLHYKHGLTMPQKETPALVFGSAVHCAILEPDEFPLRYAVADPAFFADRSLNRATKEGKERWARWLETHPGDADLDADTYKARVFAETNPGKTILSESDYRRALAIRDKVRNHPIARRYVTEGSAEVTMQWTDPETQIACKCRIDRRPAPAVLADLKTARTITAERFASAAWGLGYFHQLAFYRRSVAVEQRCSVEAVTLRFVVVESEPPHDVAVFEPEPDSMFAADAEIGELLARLKRCRESDEWPGQYDTETLLPAPRWAIDDGKDDWQVEEMTNAAL